MKNRLNIAFLWHMHQPLYKDPFTGRYAMPWVLFHATKDYYDMAAILDEFPAIHQNFNVVPCLVDQIREYASGDATDLYREMSARCASDLTDEERGFIIRNFFQAGCEKMIRPLPRYVELLGKRGDPGDEKGLSEALRYFNDQDFLDLQVLFNLVWVDPEIRRRDAFLSDLYHRGGGFTEAEKLRLLERQTEIAGMILPKYRELSERGVIELSTTPYYHPILPLLCDAASAREAAPGITLPRDGFAFPDDARAQLDRARSLHAETFGTDPAGLWPSEGSVSMEALSLAAGAGFEWAASDEQILSRSLGRHMRRDSRGNCLDTYIYRPYRVETASGALSMVFRDHLLSDLIGFDYARVDAAEAASDLVSRLVHIHSALDEPGEHLVSIILDGENAWENYVNDGRNFLVELYGRLSEDERLECVTVSEFLSGPREPGRLGRVWPGSWINHDFRIWIGHDEDNSAWEFIARAREALAGRRAALGGHAEGADKEALDEAWEELYAAEGSDWFWWYGDDHSTSSDAVFDTLFRLRIKKIYALIGMEPPVSLERPISSGVKPVRPEVTPTAPVSPEIDGEISNYYEWLTAGRFGLGGYGGAMHRAGEKRLIEGVSYGFSAEKIFFRLDYAEGAVPPGQGWGFTFNFLHPRAVRIECRVMGKTASAVLFGVGASDDGSARREEVEIASDTVVELAVPLAALGVQRGSVVEVTLSIDAAESSVARWPAAGALLLDLPAEGYEEYDWIV